MSAQPGSLKSNSALTVSPSSIDVSWFESTSTLGATLFTVRLNWTLPLSALSSVAVIVTVPLCVGPSFVPKLHDQLPPPVSVTAPRDAVSVTGLPSGSLNVPVFVAVDRFGTLGRNVVIGPSFHTTDASIMRTMTIAQRYRLQLRADVFDLFNRANFGPPGNVVGSPTFAKISRTRLPTGEAGSSRQVQLVIKFLF